MANFESIVQWLLYIEDDKKTPGKIVDLHDGVGLTRLGLTQRWHQADLPLSFFSTMPFAEAVTCAKAVYKKQYWTSLCGDQIEHDQVAAPLLSFAVNDSVRIAVKTLQSVLGVTEDGSLGPKTLAELNSKDPDIVAKLFRAEWIDFYKRDIMLNPGKAEFLNGWINRVDFPYPSPLVPVIYQ
jgi:lysozyme family protein